MTIANEQQTSQPLSRRCESPTDETTPPLAISAYSDVSRCPSTMSHASDTDADSGDGFSHQLPSSYHSRRSDLSVLSRLSTQSQEGSKPTRRRGYMRPHGTDFAASARSRESVMSLGSIAHLQYYFARTGLLDGKGGQLARKKPKGAATLDLSALESPGGLDADSSYASMGSSPDFANGSLLESPEADTSEEFDESFGESESDMLDPTVSTYNRREVTVPKPPTILELKAELESTLATAATALQQVRQHKAGTNVEPLDATPAYANMPEANTQSWYELQGMHILDVVTLAIRAAKMYYTAHELPDRLDSIKSEKQIRADLLAVMETLKQMGIRNFKGGMRVDEIDTVDGWIDSVFDILKKEKEIDSAEHAERASWAWLSGDWSGRELERERAFLVSMDPEADPPIPEWTPVAEADANQLPTPFLQAMQNGVCLIKLHNCVVKRSRRRFGAIPTFHTDTQKPYRCADNLRYWRKAAQLRFELSLSLDALAVQYNDRTALLNFEAAILQWCRRLRAEISEEVGS